MNERRGEGERPGLLEGVPMHFPEPESREGEEGANDCTHDRQTELERHLGSWTAVRGDKHGLINSPQTKHRLPRALLRMWAVAMGSALVPMVWDLQVYISQGPEL